MTPAPYILVVDDDWMNREMIEAQLQADGHAVKLAANGKKALALIDAARPALILLDMRMPEMDGIEVCRQIRRRATTKDIPVVMITGLDAEADIKRSLDAGADDFLSKPFSSLLLLARIKTLLRITALQDTLKQYQE